MLVKPNSTIHMYAVVIEPELEVKRLERELIGEMLSAFRKKYPGIIIISDTSKIIYTGKKLNKISDFLFEKTIFLKRVETQIKISVTYAKTIEISKILADPEQFPVLKSAYETIIKNSNYDAVHIRNGCYNPKHASVSGDHKHYQIWSGWREKVMISPGSELFLNIDLTYAAIVKKGELIDYIKKILGRENLSDLVTGYTNRDFNAVCVEIKGMEIKCKHNSITKKVVQLVNETANSYTFEFTHEGENYTNNVREYFKLKYNTILRYPEYPLVQIGPISKNIYIPMELALIYKPQLYTGGETCINSEIIKYSSTDSTTRFDQTNKLVVEGFVGAANSVLNEFGLSIKTGMVQVAGMNLTAPAIHYGYNKSTTSSRGKFFPPKGAVYYEPSKINNMVVYDFNSHTPKANDFWNKFIDIAEERGIRISFPKTKIISETMLNNWRNISQIIDTKADIIIFIVPNDLTTFQYGNLKSVCDLLKGNVSQVIKSINVSKVNYNVISNILLKINTKAGGINFCAQVPPTLSNLIAKNIPYMIMGADVTHPTASQQMEGACASFASVVSSLDNDACKYTNQVVFNQRGRDIIDSMDEVIQTSLLRYEQINKILPKRIFMFRDGLSEGQFFESRKVELHAMKKGISTFKQNYNPSITFMCVQKRHHTRFYDSGNVGSYDCQPGLIVPDKLICEKLSFYLLSHKNIKGTAKAAHYKLMYDDGNFSLSQLAEFAFALCHNYARCCSSVSIPAPTYYAHLGAFRTNIHRVFQESASDPVSNARKNLKNPKLSQEEYTAAKDTYFDLLKQSVTPHQRLTNV
ncbi:hypothetical protein HZS_6718, partial [Henneguya salminicola]